MIEQWLPVPAFPDYEISSEGRLRKVSSGFLLKPWVHNKSPYYCYTLTDGESRKNFMAHRLVAMVFLGPPPGNTHQIAHIDGSKQNNSVANLRWATPAENQADRLIHGTSNTGSRHPLSKLTESDVVAMRKMRRAGAQSKDIARRFGIGASYASQVLCGRLWAHVPDHCAPDRGSTRKRHKNEMLAKMVPPGR